MSFFFFFFFWNLSKLNKFEIDSIEPSHGWIIGLTILMAVMVLVVGTFIFIIIRNKDYQEIPESTPETTA